MVIQLFEVLKMSTQHHKLMGSLPRRRAAAKPANVAADFHATDWPMHYLLTIVRIHTQNVTRVLQPFNCSPLAWRVLSTLADRDGHSVNNLAELCVVERSNLSKLLDSMERDGLIERVAPEGDRRKILIYLSDKGRDLFERSLPAVLRSYATFLAGISPSEMNVFMDVLKKIKSDVQVFDIRDVQDA